MFLALESRTCVCCLENLIESIVYLLAVHVFLSEADINMNLTIFLSTSELCVDIKFSRSVKLFMNINFIETEMGFNSFCIKKFVS